MAKTSINGENGEMAWRKAIGMRSAAAEEEAKISAAA
jgi:hypothetical protein